MDPVRVRESRRLRLKRVEIPTEFGEDGGIGIGREEEKSVGGGSRGGIGSGEKRMRRRRRRRRIGH